MIVAMGSILLAAALAAQGPGTLTIASPNGQVSIGFSLATVDGVPGTPVYRVDFRGRPVIAASRLGLDFVGAAALDRQLTVVSSSRRTNSTAWENPLGAKRIVPDRYRELTVLLREQAPSARRVEFVFRAYDEGIAFRYRLPADGNPAEVTISSEETEFRFARAGHGYVLNMGRFNTHNEAEHPRIPLAAIEPTSIINLPLLVDLDGGPWVGLLEADLNDYAGMYLGGVARVANALTVKLSVPPGRKAEEAVVGRTPLVTPWRVALIGPEPGRLIESNYLLLDLSPPVAIGDASWIKPGKAAWDWWSGSTAHGVDFKPGMNTATMKHYVDFAAARHLEFMLIDAGWYRESTDRVVGNLLETIPEIDLPAIVAHAKAKGVEILLWVEWRSFDRQLEEATALFERWGVAGVKIDYMNRDDQEMVGLYRKWLEAAARHHLTVDLHGAYKGTGLQRTYPNLLTREGVMGMEYNKWSDRITPEHNVTLPFTRMLAGPMDFTPGGFRNTARGQFRIQDIEPMAQGTRAHQLAMYVVYESPLVMVSDFPEAYDGQPGIEFIEKVPVVWDDTKLLAGHPGEYIAIARQHDEAWYLGAMTNWDRRHLSLPLDFLGPGRYAVESYQDGPNAATVATDLTVRRTTVSRADRLELDLVPGGGAAVILTRVP